MIAGDLFGLQGSGGHAKTFSFLTFLVVLSFVLLPLSACSDGGEQSVDSSGSKSDESEKPVSINGVDLTAEQVDELEQTYSVRPMPGDYWYDAVSGLYGVKGHVAYGFMFPGHSFGTLAADASAGNTDVFVNGRRLPKDELTLWSQILGYLIQPGRYWFDASGNAGYEGNPMPTVNLFMAAQANSYTGGGGSGDNFWSSRFGAGNFDQGNTCGYVSVPGHGPVGYGF